MVSKLTKKVVESDPFVDISLLWMPYCVTQECMMKINKQTEQDAKSCLRG